VAAVRGLPAGIQRPDRHFGALQPDGESLVAVGHDTPRLAGVVIPSWVDGEGGRDTGIAIGFMTADSSGALLPCPASPSEGSWCHGGAPTPRSHPSATVCLRMESVHTCCLWPRYLFGLSPASDGDRPPGHPTNRPRPRRLPQPLLPTHWCWWGLVLRTPRSPSIFPANPHRSPCHNDSTCNATAVLHLSQLRQHVGVMSKVSADPESLQNVNGPNRVLGPYAPRRGEVGKRPQLTPRHLVASHPADGSPDDRPRNSPAQWGDRVFG